MIRAISLDEKPATTESSSGVRRASGTRLMHRRTRSRSAISVARLLHLLVHRGRYLRLVWRFVLLRLQIRKRQEAKGALSSLLHAHRIHRNLQQPGLRLKLGPRRRTRGINPPKCKQECLLAEILTLLPVMGETIDHMEDQLSIIGDKPFNGLSRRVCFHLPASCGAMCS